VLQAESEPKPGRKPKDPLSEEVEQLRRENERLRARLEKAELVIELQKKLSLLLGLKMDENDSDEGR